MRSRFKPNNIIALIIAVLLIITGIVLGVINKHSQTEAPVATELSAE